MPHAILAKQALQRWARENDVSPTEFARAMDYTYNHAYQLLRGKVGVRLETIGRLLVAYGPEVAEQVAEAMRAADGKGGKDD